MTTLRMTAPASPARTGVWIGIAAITMSFAAYTSALVVRQGSGGDWQHFQLPPILYLNTLLLLASSGTLEVGAVGGRLAADAGGRRGGRLAGSLTLALGLLFIAGQVLAWRELAAQGLFLATNPSSAFFYVFTALHALHLLGGVVALGYVLGRLAAPPPARRRWRRWARRRSTGTSWLCSGSISCWSSHCGCSRPTEVT